MQESISPTLGANIFKRARETKSTYSMLTAEYYLISEKRAEEIKNEVVNAVKLWRSVAKKYHASESEIALKSLAFNIINSHI